MKNIHFIRNNHALAGVIEALLLVALLAIVLSTIQLVYVPIIMEQKESEHMDIVENQFAHLKSVIETQSIMGLAGGKLPIVYSPMSSPITLGGNELPYFISQGSQGTINIIDKVKSNREINADSYDLPNYYLNGIPLTSVIYESTNYYFVNQKYILEGGAIFLEQPNQGNTIIVDIPIKVKEENATIKIYYTIPVFKAPIYQDNINGKDNCFVRTNYNSSPDRPLDPDPSDDFLEIKTDYANAWYNSLVRDDSGVLWEYLDYIKVTTDNSTYVKIERSGDDPIDIQLTIVEIDIQVGAGYVIKDNK